MNLSMMDVKARIIRKLVQWRKWGGSHTENIFGGLPGHLRGAKVVDKAIQELYQLEFLTKLKKTGEWHVSLNPRKKEEIYRFLGLPPRF